MNNIPVVTRNILIINVLVWLACYILGYKGIDLVNILGLHYFQQDQFYLFQLFTHIFTHKDFFHIFFNMFAVFMFGSLLERVWGSKRYLTFYLVTGLGAGLVQMLVNFLRYKYFTADLTPFEMQEMYTQGLGLLRRELNWTGALGDANLIYNSVAFGASGAVFGLLLAFGMLFPNAPLYLMFIPIPIKAKYFVTGYALIELFLGVANRSGDNVAHFAHLGGLIFGVFMILYWKKKGVGNGFNSF